MPLAPVPEVIDTEAGQADLKQARWAGKPRASARNSPRRGPGLDAGLNGGLGFAGHGGPRTRFGHAVDEEIGDELGILAELFGVADHQRLDADAADRTGDRAHVLLDVDVLAQFAHLARLQ